MRELCPKLPLVLADDDEQVLKSVSALLASAGINNIISFSDSRDVIPYLSRHKASLAVLDMRMPYINGYELLCNIKEQEPDIPVIMVTASQDLNTAIDCMKKGAIDYIIKPVEKSRFLTAIRNAIDLVEMRNELSSLREYLLGSGLKNPGAFSDIITRSPLMLSIFRYLEAISQSRQPLLITGETGVGKEMIAKAVHQLSGFRGELVAVNVAGLDDTMFSDTLFGHVKGAFTGADRSRDGMVHAAAGGTLFLDEIGDISATSQIKLLRMLQDNLYFPLGSDLPKRSTTRVIAATNRDLTSAISDGSFRKDLYYRFCSHKVAIPSLRERTCDIPLLLDHFIEEAARSLKKAKPACSNEITALLACYEFPGNVRELQALVLDAVARNSSGILTAADLVALPVDRKALPGLLLPALSCSFNRFPTMSEMEDYLIMEALERSGGNKSSAALLLGITRQGLHKRLGRIESPGSE